VQPSVHSSNREPESAVAVSRSSVPGGRETSHWPGQLMLPSALVIVPPVGGVTLSV